MSATGEHRSADKRDIRETGATLLEMLVVVGLMALIGTTTLASFRPALRRASLGAARSQVILALAQTRAAAIRSGRQATLAISPDGESYTAAGHTVGLGPGERIAAEPSILTYWPEGTSPGGVLRLSAARRRLDLQIMADGRVVQGPG